MLKEWQEAGVPVTEQAARLDRTVDSVNDAIERYGCVKKQNGWGNWWTEEELEKLKFWQETGVPIKEQARRFKRGINSVKTAIQRYKLQQRHQERRDIDLRCIILDRLSRGFSVGDIMRERNLKSHTSISRIVREMVKDGLVRKVGYGKYELTKKWTSKDDDERR